MVGYYPRLISTCGPLVVCGKTKLNLSLALFLAWPNCDLMGKKNQAFGVCMSSFIRGHLTKADALRI